MPPLAAVGLGLMAGPSVRDWEFPRGSVRRTVPGVLPRKSPSIVIRRDALVVSLLLTTALETWSSSGVVTDSSQPVPEIGSSGVSSWVVLPGQTSHASDAVR